MYQPRSLALILFSMILTCSNKMSIDTNCPLLCDGVHRSKYTGCNRRNGPDFGRVFLRSYYTDITQNTNIQSSMVTEILAREV